MRLLHQPDSRMLQPLQRIIAATDFSFSAHRAARRAGLIAKERGASVQLLHVLDSSAPIADRGEYPSTAEARQALQQHAERSLSQLADDVVAAGGERPECSLQQGRVTPKILAEAANADLLVIGPRGVNPLRDLLLGSTAERIARKITRPMLVVKQNPDVAYDNVLVAVDPSDDAMKVLEFAAHVAPRATLQVFHALDDSLMGRLRSAGVRDDAISAYTAELLGDARTRLDEYVAKLHGRSIFVKVEPGDARVLIPQQAAAMGASLIVMGKQGMSWLAESIVGSVARRVLEQATCDVLVVPQGPAGNSN